MTLIPEDAIKCLDKGFVRLVDSMGGDDAIVQAARVSYGQGTSKVSQDRGLSPLSHAPPPHDTFRNGRIQISL